MKKAPHIRGYRGAHTGLVSCSLGNFKETGPSLNQNGIKAAAKIMLFLLSAKQFNNL